MKVSLVLSTYNGEKYIEEQLESLYRQTRQLDNVLILDDKSTDGTVGIIEEFIRKYELINWDLKVNEKNQGWKKNFWKGLRDSESDIIFLCDQDDIWDYRKVEIMTREMENNSEIQLLTCGFDALYEEGNAQKVSPVITSSMKGTGKVRKIEFSPSFMYVLRPGCTYALRADLWKACDEFWNEEIPHDAMLWRQAMIIDGLYSIDLQLIQWRRFNTNSSNPYRLKEKYHNKYIMMYYDILDNVIRPDNVYLEHLINYIDQHENMVEYQTKKIIRKSFLCQKALKKAFEKKSLIDMGIIFLKYRNYFYAYRTYVKYVLLVLSAKIHGIGE